MRKLSSQNGPGWALQTNFKFNPPAPHIHPPAPPEPSGWADSYPSVPLTKRQVRSQQRGSASFFMEIQFIPDAEMNETICRSDLNDSSTVGSGRKFGSLFLARTKCDFISFPFWLSITRRWRLGCEFSPALDVFLHLLCLRWHLLVKLWVNVCLGVWVLSSWCPPVRLSWCPVAFMCPAPNGLIRCWVINWGKS